ncbi:MAG: DUF2156 domain-containing protein [Bacteroidaceae bacterium]|nr:DUF2156 domain-containing protein [Bacteroidaceae bacterium]
MLQFNPITIECIDKITPFAQKGYTDSCDYTPGNLVMWARFMQYQYAIEEDTLFVKCKSQADMASMAFLVPIGELPLSESIARLQEYCEFHKQALRFTAVPEPFIDELSTLLPNHRAAQLDGWSDYIYDAESLATLRGKALNKKRNRYNKFIAEQPVYDYHRCTLNDIPEIAKFLVADRDCQHNREDNMRCYEQWQCIATVKNLKIYDQPAGVIKIDNQIVAFTLGEVFGNTLYIHIEKAKREIVGAAEAINQLFINDMLSEYKNIRMVNREEDLGDPGLRQAKKAYNPIKMLHRYEFTKTTAAI